MTEGTDVTPEKLSLMMLQLTMQMTSTNGNKSVLLLKVLALLVSDVGTCDLVNLLTLRVIKAVTGEEVAQATANTITNKLWAPVHELTGLKNDLIEWKNAGGFNANLDGLQDALKAEMKVLASKMVEDASVEAAKVTEATTAELKAAAKCMKKAAEEATGAVPELKELRAVMKAETAQRATVGGTAASQELVPPILWWNMSKDASNTDPKSAQGGDQTSTMVAMTYAKAIKVKRTLTQKQVLEKAKLKAVKVMFQSAEGPGQLNGLRNSHLKSWWRKLMPRWN